MENLAVSPTIHGLGRTGARRGVDSADAAIRQAAGPDPSEGPLGGRDDLADPKRDVGLAKQRAGRLLGSKKLHCVWSGRLLSETSLNMDHCFAWSAWPCSDLWNLMPTNRTANMHEKKAQLPSARLMVAAQDRIMSWWELAYGSSDPAIHERFVIEATSSLPGVEQRPSTDLATLFDGALSQRARLRNDQKIPEWTGDKYL